VSMRVIAFMFGVVSWEIMIFVEYLSAIL